MPTVKLPEGEGAVKPDGRVPQILGDPRMKLQLLAPDRMLEGEDLGMQPETTVWDRIAVQRIRVNGMPDGREVDPDLVRSPGLESYAEHRMSRRTLEYLEVRDGQPPYARGHEGRIVGVTAYGGVDRPRRG